MRHYDPCEEDVRWGCAEKLSLSRAFSSQRIYAQAHMLITTSSKDTAWQHLGSERSQQIREVIQLLAQSVTSSHDQCQVRPCADQHVKILGVHNLSEHRAPASCPAAAHSRSIHVAQGGRPAQHGGGPSTPDSLPIPS